MEDQPDQLDVLAAQLDTVLAEEGDSLVVAVDTKAATAMRRTIKDLSSKAHSRETQAATRLQRLQAEAADLEDAARAQPQQQQQQQQEEEEDGDAAADDEDAEDPALQEAQLADMKSRVDATLQEDEHALGPEPPCYAPAVAPVQAPAAEARLCQALADVPAVQQLLEAQQQLLGEDGLLDAGSAALQAAALSWLLRQQGSSPLEACPSDGLARAVFAVLCFGAPWLAEAAFTRLAAWCSVGELAAGAELPGTGELPAALVRQLGSGDCEGAPTLASLAPSVSTQWLPSAQDVLDALAAMGVGAAAPAAGGAGGAARKARAGAAARAHEPDAPAGQQQQQEQELAFQDGNLPLLLRLCGLLCWCHSQRRLQLGWGRERATLQQLLLALLALQLDVRAQTSCRAVLPGALAAALEVAEEVEWQRVMPALLDALAGGLGPSHRASVVLLSQLPRSARGVLLRQHGALRLLTSLLPGADEAQAGQPTARGSGARKPDLQSVRSLLGEPSAVRRLYVALTSDGPRPGKGQPVAAAAQQAARAGCWWRLLSILDAADLLLWVDVTTPGVGVPDELRRWFIAWLEALDRVADKKLEAHRVRSRLAELRNAYEFAASYFG